MIMICTLSTTLSVADNFDIGLDISVAPERLAPLVGSKEIKPDVMLL